MQVSLPEDRPAIMGILNVTPDSFSDGGRFVSPADAVAHAHAMIEDGADIIDIGGESTRPGANPVSIDEECGRVLPVIKALRSTGIPISIDTMKTHVASSALAAGASIVNDVSGFRDPRLVQVCAEAECTIVIMHMQGEPRTMQQQPTYENVVEEVTESLSQSANNCIRAGIRSGSIWIDPGVGFGKDLNHNLDILRNLRALEYLGFPVLIGVSRKSFLGKLTGEPNPSNRDHASIAAQLFAQMNGARIIRTHNVKASKEAANVWSQLSS